MSSRRITGRLLQPVTVHYRGDTGPCRDFEAALFRAGYSGTPGELRVPRRYLPAVFSVATDVAGRWPAHRFTVTTDQPQPLVVLSCPNPPATWHPDGINDLVRCDSCGADVLLSRFALVPAAERLVICCPACRFQP